LDSDFIGLKKVRLTKSAIPQKYNSIDDHELKVTTPLKVYKKNIQITPTESPKPSTSRKLFSSPSTPKMSPTTKTWINDVINFSTPVSKFKIKTCNITSPSSLYSPNKIKRLKTIIDCRTKTLKNKRSLVSKLKNKLDNSKKQLKTTNILNNKIRYCSENSKVLAEMQIFHKNISRRPWTQAEKTFSLNLFYKSPTTYKFLRNTQKITLPGITTIKKWIGNSKFRPGFNPAYFKQIEIKVGTMSDQEKYCVIVFDEMKIKSFLEYSKYLDMVEGYEDLGYKGRTTRLASQAMVFMARGLYNHWKLPLAYFVSGTSMNQLLLSNVINDVISKALNLKLNVIAIVCDQGTNNMASLKNLGLNKENPYFIVNNKKIYSIFDVPHLFKNFRNNFLKNNFIYKGNEISFKDIKEAYEIDKRSVTSRSLIKITDSHIQPGPFQKMNCKLALQIFSNSVSSALKTCISTGQIQSKTAAATADFIKEMNNLFDILNSKNLYSSNNYSCAISDERPNQLIFLNNAILWLRNLELYRPIKRYGVKIPCFDGMIWTLNAIILLYLQQKELGYKYLLTSRLNQDILENTFSIYRQRGGFNNNPTVRTFRTSFKILAKHNLMKSTENSNCESDNDLNLLSPTTSLNITPLTTNNTEFNYKSDISDTTDSCSSSQSFSSCDNNKFSNELNLETCSNTYFSGYLGKKLLDKFQCQICELTFLKDNTSYFTDKEFLIFYKTFESNIPTINCKLKKPTDILINFVTSAQIIINKLITQKPHCRKIGFKIKNEINKKLIPSININNECLCHLEFLIQCLINCKLLRTFNCQSKHLKGGQYDRSLHKLNILKRK